MLKSNGVTRWITVFLPTVATLAVLLVGMQGEAHGRHRAGTYTWIGSTSDTADYDGPDNWSWTPGTDTQRILI